MSNNICCRLCATRGMPVFQEEENNLRDIISRHLKVTVRILLSTNATTKNFSDYLKNLITTLQNVDGAETQINIKIRDDDILPKKVCKDCREKIITFNQYFEECSKVQEFFLKCWPNGAETSSNYVKYEVELVADLAEGIDLKGSRNLKNEIKLEIPDLQYESSGINDPDDTYQDSDSSIVPLLTIANLKKKKKRIKRKKVKEECDVADNYIKEDILNYDLSSDSASNIAQKTKYEANTKNSGRRKIYNRKMKDIMNFRCTICRVDCRSWYRLLSHCKRKHDSHPTVHCLLCNAAINSKSTMYKHILDHQKPSAFACDVCPVITKSAIAFENHKMRHIPKTERLYKCEKCPKILKTKDSLKTHHLTHLPIEERKRHPCAVCHMKFTAKSAAAMHKRVVHDKIKPYVCDLCGYACATGHEMRQHRAIHSEEKRFTCNVCSKSFKTDSVLRRHLETHSSTSYMCTVCNKVLKTKRTFRKHLLVHDSKRKHVCSYCKVAFKRRSTLQVHLNSHTGDKPISCRWCSEKFMYAASYRTHKQRQHPEKLIQAEPAVTLCQPSSKEHESSVVFHDSSNIGEIRQ